MRRGSPNVDVHNNGPATVPRVLVGVQVPEPFELPSWCELMPDDSGVSNTFYCYIEAFAADATRTVTLDITAAATYRGGETWPYLWVEPHTF